MNFNTSYKDHPYNVQIEETGLRNPSSRLRIVITSGKEYRPPKEKLSFWRGLLDGFRGFYLDMIAIG